MKKITAFILALIMSFSFALPSLAAQTENADSFPEDVITNDASDNDVNEELESIISTVKEIVTFIYDYATQPEEPAIDLEHLLMIVTAIVTVVYTIYQNQNA